MGIDQNLHHCVELSSVAVLNTHGEDSPYFEGWKAYEENPYDALDNPSGVIQMGLAENQVSFDMLEDYLKKKPESSSWGKGFRDFRENALFQDYHGLKTFRQALAGFMEKVRGGSVKFDPERIVLTAGATAANELLTFIIANPGDALLVPTPYYPGFDRDLRWRTRVNIIPVQCNSSNGFQITLEALEEAYRQAESLNIKIRGLLLTNPSNPLGITMKPQSLKLALDFVTRKNIHLVSDEIYSGSVFSVDEFTSIAEIIKDRKQSCWNRVHIVYSLSKDLGLPGFRVGAIYSYNDQVIKTARRMSSFSLVSSQTQQMLASMLSDAEFTERYIRTNRERLRERYECITKGLKRIGIRCLEGNAGLFCWMDMSELLEERTVEGEIRLWEEMVFDVKLNISPGSSCHCSEAGWFRVCFANMSKETLEVALERIRIFLEKRSGKKLTSLN